MLFNSIHFLLFFPIVTILYFMLAQRARLWLLLFASCYFYMVFIPEYILVLIVLIFIDYFAGILIANASGVQKKLFLILSIIANVGFLGFFKYYNFFTDNIRPIISAIALPIDLPVLHFILPIGLSFHTFQSMSYTIEVYRGHQKSERDFLLYSVYVLFYPQLVAGPIERPQNLLHQLSAKHPFISARVVSGLRLVLLGFFKKVVIADRFALIVNSVYGAPGQYDGLTLLVATYAFAIQIYCDFSGYSDIAIGTARVMGITLMTNFNQPYRAKSISEFWSRWHISLSTWFRDYVYIPLGGNRVVKYRWYFNLFIVFMISGLWHGANWTFIIWGSLHGAYLISSLVTATWRTSIVERLGINKFPRFRAYFGMFFTFHLVLVSWVFFRAASVSEALLILNKMTIQLSSSTSKIFEIVSITDTLIAAFLLIVLKIVQYIERTYSIDEYLAKTIRFKRWAIYYGFIMLIFLFGVFHNPAQFIYFQF